MKTKDELKNLVDKSFEAYVSRKDQQKAIIDLLPESLTSKMSIPDVTTDIVIGLPYSIKALCEARKQLGKGWKRKQVWGDTNPDHTYKCIRYTHVDFPNVSIRFSMRYGENNGSTCKLNLVGEKTVPVYEVVCS